MAADRLLVWSYRTLAVSLAALGVAVLVLAYAYGAYLGEVRREEAARAASEAQYAKDRAWLCGEVQKWQALMRRDYPDHDRRVVLAFKCDGVEEPDHD